MPDDEVEAFNKLSPEDQAKLAKEVDPDHEGGGADFEEADEK